MVVAAVQVAAGRRGVPGERATRRIVALMAAASGVEAWAARGWRRGVAPVAAAGAIGLVAEHVGTRTGRPFGRYTYSGKLGPRIGGVPLLAGAAWAALARPAWTAARWATPQPPQKGRVPTPNISVAVAAAALTAWDVFLDPRMVREGYWTWPAGGRYEDVPASNFLGWLVTGCAVFAVFAALDREPVDAHDDGALSLYLWTLVGETVANAGLWRRPRVAAAGALAMGAVALPALRARLR